jgi:hypothetical protein
MKNRSLGPMFVVVAMLSFTGVVFAQTAVIGGKPVSKPSLTPAKTARTPDGKPDLSGVWGVINRAPGLNTRKREESVVVEKLYGPLVNTEPAMTPWEAERYLYNHDPRKSANPSVDASFGGRQELKPSYHCVPYGPSTLFYLLQGNAEAVGGYEVIQSLNRVLIIYELDHNVRQIWMDGRGHPPKDELDLTWMGNSIGRWDGDTLVVDTVGMRNEPWLDGDGHVSSKQLHMEERFQRLDHDTMRVDVTLTDPIAFTKPWTRSMYSRLRPWDLAEDVRCYPGSQELRNQEEIFHFSITDE